jgi:hypothetical protein
MMKRIWIATALYFFFFRRSVRATIRTRLPAKRPDQNFGAVIRNTEVIRNLDTYSVA